MASNFSSARSKMLRNEGGAAMVEFALTSSLFFLMVIITLESAIAGFRALTVQYIASEAVREGILNGSTVPGITTLIVDRGDDLGIPIDAGDIQICGAEPAYLDGDGNCLSLNMGASEGFLLVHVTTTASYFLGRVTLDLVGEAVSRNERR